jgi:hypothetical protein
MERDHRGGLAVARTTRIEASQGRQIAVQAVPSVALSSYPVDGGVSPEPSCKPGRDK